jgi:hypothetical protein
MDSKRKMVKLFEIFCKFIFSIELKISFLDFGPELCYVSSFDDCEFRAGTFDEKRKHGIYSDKRWIGMEREKETNSMVGFSEAGKLYILKNC